ncbi:UNVERIFIED_CONTAM: DNA-binding NtrC family response regulator [Brevibacillus sp. OAP136]
MPADDQEAKPIKIHKILPLKEATAIVEKELLQMARERCGSTYEIAAMLGVDQSTISRKFKQFLE